MKRRGLINSESLWLTENWCFCAHILPRVNMQRNKAVAGNYGEDT